MTKISKKQKISLLLGGTALALTLYASYCSLYSRIWPLKPEEQHYIARQIEYGKRELPFVKALAKAADQSTLYDSHKESSIDGFLADLEETSRVLDTFFLEGRIYKYKGGEKGEHAFYRRPPFFLGYYVAVRDSIVINEYQLSESRVKAYELVHEAAHALVFAHEPSVTNGGIDDFSRETAQRIIQAKDFPYLVTFLYYAASRTLHDPYDSIVRKQESFVADIKRGRMSPKEAYNQLKKVSEEEKDHWISKVMKTTFPALPFTEVFGWSEEEFQDALRTSGLFEYRQRVFQSGVCTFVASYPEIHAPECNK